MENLKLLAQISEGVKQKTFFLKNLVDGGGCCKSEELTGNI